MRHILFDCKFSRLFISTNKSYYLEKDDKVQEYSQYSGWKKIKANEMGGGMIMKMLNRDQKVLVSLTSYLRSQ